MNAKVSTITWSISELSAQYTKLGGSNTITAMNAGSITVIDTKIRDGALLFIAGFTGGVFTNYFVAIATSTGLSANYKVVQGTEFALSANTDVSILMTDAIFNIPIADVARPAATYTGSALTFPTSKNLSTLVVVEGSTNGTGINAYMIAEVIGAGTTPTYRILKGADFTPSGTGYVVWTVENPHYNRLLIEDLLVEDIAKVEDADNGQWIGAKDQLQFEHAIGNFGYDGQIMFYKQDKGVISAYRGITSTNGVFIRAPRLHYYTENIPLPIPATK